MQVEVGPIKLINADCMNVMRAYPDKYFDIAIVDPPYGIGASMPSVKPSLVKQKNGKVLPIKQARYTHKDWDNDIPKREYFEELSRVSRHQIIFGVNYFSSVYEFGVGRIVWDKMNGKSDQFGCEIAYNSINNRTDIVHYMWAGMFQGRMASENCFEAMRQIGNKKLNEKRVHPTQKPIKLYDWILRKYTKDGDRILDTHLGSGSSAIASYDLGRELVGIEIDHEYFQLAQDRLTGCTKHQKLFRL